MNLNKKEETVLKIYGWFEMLFAFSYKAKMMDIKMNDIKAPLRDLSKVLLEHDEFLSAEYVFDNKPKGLELLNIQLNDDFTKVINMIEEEAENLLNMVVN